MKKVKDADIARYLNISRASVSLAVNGKPGISEELRMKILKAKEEFANCEIPAAPLPSEASQKLTMFVFVNSGDLMYQPEIRVDDSAFPMVQETSRQAGYELSIVYVTSLNFQEKLENELKDPALKGCILFASELCMHQFPSLENCPLPVIVIDHDAHRNFSSSVLDNEEAAHEAVEVLGKKASEILYLANSHDLYNFEKRREGFIEECTKKNIPFEIYKIGTSIVEMKNNIKAYLKEHPLPQAVLLENNQVGAGFLQAMMEMGIDWKNKTSLICFDKIPEYLSFGNEISYFEFDHWYRMKLAVQTLCDMIQDKHYSAYQIRTLSKFIQTDSIL